MTEKEWNLYVTGYEGTEIYSLADIVEFNKHHPNNLGKLCLWVCSLTICTKRGLTPQYVQITPNQQLLERALNSRMPTEKYAEGVKIICEAAGVNGINKTLADFNLDVIIGPMDGRTPAVAAATGYPVGTMPLG